LKSHEIDIMSDSMIFHHREFYEVAIWEGLRTGEQCALQWDDVDRNNRTLHVNKSFNRKK